MKTSRLSTSALLSLAAWLLCAAAVLAQAPTELPPRVVACSPEPFATNVDPDLPEIAITFDQPMNTETKSGFGYLRWAGVFPGVRDAEPTWDEGRTVCTLPVELEPDVTYAVAVNTSKQRNFTDQAGVAALSFAWVFATGERTPDDFPAHVVSSDPPLGATDVDAHQREISVTFSRPVAPGDFSWVILRGSGVYPGQRGGPSPTLSDDRLTASLAVLLSPGTVYALSVNDVYYFGYKDTRGHPVLPFGWCFKTAD